MGRPVVSPVVGPVVSLVVGSPVVVGPGVGPPLLVSAFGVLLFGMFVAIVVPVAAADRAVLGVVVAAVVLSCLLACLPWTAGLDVGWRIIIVTLVVSAIAATVAPVEVSE